MAGHVAFTGNLVRDVPAVRKLDDGRSWVAVDVAENTRIKDDDGKWVDGETKFHNVFVTGRLAENLAASNLKKGSELVVSGWEGEPSSYEDKVSGEVKQGPPSVSAHSIGAGLSRATATITPARKNEVGIDPAGIDPALTASKSAPVETSVSVA